MVNIVSPVTCALMSSHAAILWPLLATTTMSDTDGDCNIFQGSHLRERLVQYNMYSGCDNCRRHVGLMIVVCGIIHRVVAFCAMDICDDDMPNSAKDEHTLGFLQVLLVKNQA